MNHEQSLPAVTSSNIAILQLLVSNQSLNSKVSNIIWYILSNNISMLLFCYSNLITIKEKLIFMKWLLRNDYVPTST